MALLSIYGLIPAGIIIIFFIALIRDNSDNKGWLRRKNRASGCKAGIHHKNKIAMSEKIFDIIFRMSEGHTIVANDIKTVKDFIISHSYTDNHGSIMIRLKKLFPATWKNAYSEINREIFEYTLPTSYAAYLIYSKVGTLKKNEVEQINSFLDWHRIVIIDIKKDVGLIYTNDLNTIYTNCSIYRAKKIRFDYNTFRWNN
jgi:hypothetical protein